MKKNLTLLFVVLFIQLTSGQTISQKVIASAGNYAASSAVLLSYTIGETIGTTIGSSNILTQGFQQPSDKADGIQKLDLKNLNITIYPNPANESVNIFITSKENAPDLSVGINDVLGRELLLPTAISSNSKEQSFNIDLSNLSAAMYFIVIRDNKNNMTYTSKINKITF